MASATNKTAPTPSENPLMLISPTRYPNAMTRNNAIIGYCSSSALMNSIMSSRSINRQTTAPKLPPHTFRQIGGGRLHILQRVFETESLPFVPAHLVKPQDLDALN